MVNQTTMNVKPLITFALFSYNQEDYIREAVEGALSQTYTPLEIVISDDCSTDQTAIIIKELIAQYHGNHNIVLNLNKRNIGLAGNVNKVMDMATGELIVLAAGDDISYPERTEILVSEWLKHGKIAALCSDIYSIDETGLPLDKDLLDIKNFRPLEGEKGDKIIKRFIQYQMPSLIGCSEAWSKDLVTHFPKLNTNLAYEDKAYSFRAWMLGDIVYLPQKLVQYRLHDKNVSLRKTSITQGLERFLEVESVANVEIEKMISLLENHINDLNYLQQTGSINDFKYKKLKKLLMAEVCVYKTKKTWWKKSYINRIFSLLLIIRNKPVFQTLVWGVVRLLPYVLYRSFKVFKFKKQSTI